MAEETIITQSETTEVPLGEATMAEFKKARADGKEVVERAKADEVTEQPEDKEDDPQPKRAKGGFQARIDRLIKQQATLEQELASERKARQEIEARGKTEDVPKTEQAKTADDEPKREDFDSDLSYVKALTRWEVRMELKQEREAEEKKTAAEAHKEAISDYNKRAIEASSKYEDWDEVLNKSDSRIPPAVGEAIIHTIQNGPDLAYYLAQHPETCEEMMAMHPLAAVAMASKLAEQIETAEPEKDTEDAEEKEEVVAKPERKAPAPIRPVAGGKTRSTIPLDRAGFQDYKKLRQQGHTR